MDALGGSVETSPKHATAPMPGAQDGHGPLPSRPAIGSRFRFRARNLGYRITVRILDVIVSASLLLLLSSLMVAIAIRIKLDSPGPAIFRHRRIGLFGRPFTLYKFRTMYADAKDRFPELYAYTYSQEELYSLPIKVLVGRKQNPKNGDGGVVNLDAQWLEDPRVTRIGRWLRRTSLDELPNFINVLKGDMHLVGPRPDIAENIRYYSPDHLRKLHVKPGITGLAQIRGRGKLSFTQTNEFDVEYVDTRSLVLDLKILWNTTAVWVKGDGAF